MPSAMTIWNLFLAIVPVVAAYALAAVARRARIERRPVTAILAIPLGLVWLAFLPNTCYLMTEWRHFLFHPHFQAVRSATNPNDLGALRVVKQAAFFAAYSGFGVASFALAIRPVAQMLRNLEIRPWTFAVPFFVTVSLGVYIGLILRLNSWDLALRPRYVVILAASAMLRPALLAVILGYAAVLGLAYLFCDIWIEGLRIRLHRWGWGSIRQSLVAR
jgi:uncharacterized membrane protein